MAWLTFALAMLFVASMAVAFYQRTYGGIFVMGLFMLGGWLSFTTYGFPIDGRMTLTVASVAVFLVCVRKKWIDARQSRKPKSLQLEGGVVPHVFE